MIYRGRSCFVWLILCCLLAPDISVVLATQIKLQSNNNNVKHINYNTQIYDDAIELNQQPSIFQIFTDGLSDYFVGSNVKQSSDDHLDTLSTSTQYKHNSININNNHKSLMNVEQVLKSFSHFASGLKQHYFGSNNNVEKEDGHSIKIQKGVPLFGIDKATEWKKINNIQTDDITTAATEPLPINKAKLSKAVFHNDNLEHLQQTLALANDTKSQLCNYIGYLTFSMESQNTCQGQACYPRLLKCDNETITVNISTPITPGYDYSQCQLLEMECRTSTQPVSVFSFKDQFHLQYCQITQLSCHNKFLSQCQIIDSICDNSTSFGSDTFGFSCLNQQLVCGDNNTIVPPANFTQYSAQIKSGECSVQNISCTPQDECLVLDLSCQDKNQNCTVSVDQQLPCLLGCNANMNTSSCDCPADYTSNRCQSATPITCDLNLNSPHSQCPGENYVLSKKTCFGFDYHGMSNFSFTLDCQFTQTVPPTKHNFTYWVDLPNLKLSNPVSWSVSNSIINFNKLFDYSYSTTISILRDQIQQLNPIWINTTLSTIPADYWVAKRLYFETGMITTKSHSVLMRYFVKSDNYPLNQVPSVELAKWKIVLISISCILLVGGGMWGAFVLYRKYYRVI